MLNAKVQESLCFHVRSLMSDLGIVSQERLKTLIGQLTSLNDAQTLVETSNDFSLTITRLFEANYDLELPYRRMRYIQYPSPIHTIGIDGKSHTIVAGPSNQLLIELIRMDGRSTETHKVWAGMMKLKTCLKHEQVPRSSKDDAYKAITHGFNADHDPNVFQDLEVDLRRSVTSLVMSIGLERLSITDLLPIYSHPQSDKVYFTYLDPTNDDSYIKLDTVKRYELSPYNVGPFLMNPSVWNIYKRYPEEFIGKLLLGEMPKSAKIESSGTDEQPIRLFTEDRPLQMITFFPEWGLKDRSIVVPNACLQSLTYNMALRVSMINKLWKIQGVYSHSNCCEQIQSIMSRRLSDHNIPIDKFHSIDLSKVTDRLPYQGLQRVVLDQLRLLGVISDMDLEIMDLSCQSLCCFDRDPTKLIRYEVGTQMGTFPSFPLMSLTNGLLASIAFQRSTKTPPLLVKWNKLPFRVVGDDFSCWHNQTAELYAAFMRKLGVELSEHKCLRSYYACEMCSKIITSAGVFEQKKLKLLDKDDQGQAVHNHEYFGPSVDTNYSEEIQQFLYLLGGLPKPLGFGERPITQEVQSLIQAYECVRSVKDMEDVIMNYSDYTILQDRILNCLPNLSVQLLERGYHEEPKLTPMEKSLILDIKNLDIQMRAPNQSLDDLVKIAQSIEVIYNYLYMTLEKRNVLQFFTKEVRHDQHLAFHSKKKKKVEERLEVLKEIIFQPSTSHENGEDDVYHPTLPDKL